MSSFTKEHIYICKQAVLYTSYQMLVKSVMQWMGAYSQQISLKELPEQNDVRFCYRFSQVYSIDTNTML